MAKNMTIGQRLRKRREQLRKTQADIAAEVDCTQPTVTNWEADRVLPRTDQVRLVARAYRINPLSLLPAQPRKAS